MFLNAKGQREHVYATSWGVSTRLIGALIMAHSDDTGLVLPPRIASTHVVVVPISKTPEERAKVMPECAKVVAELKAQGLGVHLDDREGLTPGAKYYEWEMKGVPLRIEVGPRDVDSGSLAVARRIVREIPGEDEKATRGRKKSFLPRAEALSKVRPILDEMQKDLFQRALDFRTKHSRVVDTLDDYEKYFKEGGGFAWVHWAGGKEGEEEMARRFKTSIRNIPFEGQGPAGSEGEGKCILTGKPSTRRVVMSEAY